MTLIDNLALALMWLVRVGVVLRIMYIFVVLMGDEDKEIAYKKRIKYTVWFYIFSESIYQIQALIERYY
jgi:high-affinity K+ transport system ATPase subunit B